MADHAQTETAGKQGGTRRWVKRVLTGLAAIVLVGGGGVGAYAYTQTSAYDESINKVYDVAPTPLARSSDAVVIARGKHLAETLGGCAMRDCHGKDLGGGKATEAGPLATFVAPNITPGGMGVAYSDSELARLVRHGIKKDGRTIQFMPVLDFNWLPDSDLVAIISYIRTVPAVDRPNRAIVIKPLGKIIDRKGGILIDQARRIDHAHVELGPVPSPTAEYGKYIGRLCMGCHGEHLSGGPIPGAPSDFAVPLNLTPHASGMAGWTYADFDKLLTTGTRKNGKPLDPFMPYESLALMDDTEKHALFAFLQGLAPLPFGGR